MSCTKFSNIVQLKDAHSYHANGHFFDAVTMRFFKSRVSEYIYPTKTGAYFVTSEKERDSVRRYTVRFCTLTGVITKVGEFQQYKTSAQAHNAAKHAAKGDEQ
jgi:dihydrodipicolinate synthase/N-acetylneuraminate lyase